MSERSELGSVADTSDASTELAGPDPRALAEQGAQILGAAAQGVLYIVATPIGHLGDLSDRAVQVLKGVSIIAAEDTRRTTVLLQHIGHRAPQLISLHDHNEERASAELLAKLQQGQSVALVSDAGTPLINDPGFALVRLAHSAGIETVPVPGACSITAALSICPLPCHPFRFVGFLPAKAQAREQLWTDALASSDATVFLEAPHRIEAAVAALVDLQQQGAGAGKGKKRGNAPLPAGPVRRLMLARELTKRHETRLVGEPQQVLAQLQTAGAPRGEFIGVLESSDEVVASFTERRVVSALLKDLPPTQAAKLAANICGVKKSAMYKLALHLSKGKPAKGV